MDRRENPPHLVLGGVDQKIIKGVPRARVGLEADINILTHDMATLGLWGPRAKDALGHFIDPSEISIENFPFVAAKYLTLNLSGGKTIDVWAARISYVGESGWEIYLNNDSEEGLALYDSLLEVGVVPVGIETYANMRSASAPSMSMIAKCDRLIIPADSLMARCSALAIS